MNKFRILGIDAGTTALKVVLYDEKGNPIASDTNEYMLQTPSPEIVETDPDIYWKSLKISLKKISEKLNENPLRVNSLAISSQGESFVPVDREGVPLRNTIVWLDSRSKKEAEIIRKKFGSKAIYHTTGSPEVDPTWASTKILWIKNNEPDLFKKIFKILFVEDLLIYRLTGKFVANGTLYCSSLLFDIINYCWWQDMLDFIGLKIENLPELVKPGSLIGKISTEAASDLGITDNVDIIAGGMDQACGCIGTGNIYPGFITENTGSAINISITTDKPVFDPLQRVPCQVHILDNKYIYLPWNKTAGMLLKWFRDNFCEKQIEEADKEGLDSYEYLTRGAESISPGSNGLITIPHFAGAMSPEVNEDARGVIYGLNLSTDRNTIIRSILESVAFMLRTNIELIEESGIEIREIISSGGASNSRLWNQIKSDILGKKIKTIKNKDSCCLGAAIIAGVGSGHFKSIDSACRSIIASGEEYSPNLENKKIYDKYYDIYKELYKSLEPIYKKSSKIIKSK